MLLVLVRDIHGHTVIHLPLSAPIPRYWTPSDFVHEDGADREGREWNEEPARVENVDVYSITRLPPDALLTFYYTIL